MMMLGFVSRLEYDNFASTVSDIRMRGEGRWRGTDCVGCQNSRNYQNILNFVSTYLRSDVSVPSTRGSPQNMTYRNSVQ